MLIHIESLYRKNFALLLEANERRQAQPYTLLLACSSKAIQLAASASVMCQTPNLQALQILRSGHPFQWQHVLTAIHPDPDASGKPGTQPQNLDRQTDHQADDEWATRETCPYPI